MRARLCALGLLATIVAAPFARADGGAGAAPTSAFQTQLNQTVKDRDGVALGNLVDILVTPRSGQLVAVIQPPAGAFPLAVPYTDLSFSDTGASIAGSAKELNGQPKELVVVGQGIQSKRFGRLPANTGLMAVASVPTQELRYPALPNQAEPYLRAQNNLDVLWKNAIKPLQ